MTNRSRLTRSRLTWSTLLALLSLVYMASAVHLTAQMTVSNTGSGGSNGLAANEAGQISSCGGGSGCGSVHTDTMWADSSIHRWVMQNNGGTNILVSAWPCSSQGCIPMSGPQSGSTSYYPETPLVFPTAAGPGLPLISGALTSGAGYPQWGGGGSNQVYALDLQTGTLALALASEVPNDTSTGGGTSNNQLAKVTPTGALTVKSGDPASMPTYIVATGGTNSGNAQLALDGEALCTVDATVLAGSLGKYVIASSGTPGDCTVTSYTSAAQVPFGTWIIGQWITNTTITSGNNGLVLVHPGYRSLGTITSLSYSSGTILATANSNLSSSSSGDVITADLNGNVQDSLTAANTLVLTPTGTTNLTQYAPVVGNASNKTVISGSATGTLSSSTKYVTNTTAPGATTNLASWDGNGNLVNSNVAGTKPFQSLPGGGGNQSIGNSAGLTTVVTSETIPASTNASFTCFLAWQASSTTAKLEIVLSASATPTAINAGVTIQFSTSAPNFGTIVANNGNITSSVASSTTPFYYVTVSGTLENGSSAGTLALQAAAPISSTSVTILRGGFCKTFY